MDSPTPKYLKEIFIIYLNNKIYNQTSTKFGLQTRTVRNLKLNATINKHRIKVLIF